jgi:hypothetical protein
MPGRDANSVNIHLRASGGTGEIRAGVSGIYRCGSPWLCPVCAVGKAHERAERVRNAADATFARGGMAALVVLTASHSINMSLAEIKALVQGASSAARKGRAWTNAVERYGILGVIVGQEVTYSLENGWHYHQHLSVMVDGPTLEEKALKSSPVSPERIGPMTFVEWLPLGLADVPAAEISSRFIGPLRLATPNFRAIARAIAYASGDRIGPPTLDEVFPDARKRAQAAGDWLANAYTENVRAAGGKVSDRHGWHVRVANDADDASNYTAKGSMAWEISGGHKDETKAETSLTPWDIAVAASDGDRAMFGRWREYMEVMPGTRSCVVSAALAQKLGIAAGGDDEQGEQVLHEADEVVGRVEAPVWKKWIRHGLAATFLSRVEYGGEDGFIEAVAATEQDSEAREAEYQRLRAARAAKREVSKEDRATASAKACAWGWLRAHSGSAAGRRDRIAEAIHHARNAFPLARPLDPADFVKAAA